MCQRLTFASRQCLDTPGAYSAGTKGATNIDVVARAYIDISPTPDLNTHGLIASQHQCVCARKRLHIPGYLMRYAEWHATQAEVIAESAL